MRDYANIDPSLSILSDQQISRLAECVADNFDPFVIGDAHIVSETGQTAYGEFIIVPRTAGELAQMPATVHSAVPPLGMYLRHGFTVESATAK